MKRRDLIRLINEHARRAGLKVTYREGGLHTRVTLGKTVVTIPRHREINTITARKIMKTLDVELGKGWSGYGK